MEDYGNSNGLVNGLIPAGKPCPFYKECECFSEEICPTEVKPRKGRFSCALARLLSLGKNNDKRRNSK